MKTNIKQNKNSSVKRISCFVLSAFVLLISISVPAFADTTPASTNGVDFTDQPIPEISTPTSPYSDMVGVYTYSGSYGRTNTFYISGKADGEVDEIYAFTYLDGINTKVALCSYSSLWSYYSFSYDGVSNPSVTSGNVTNSFGELQYVFVGSRSTSSLTLTNNIPSFSSLQDGLDAVEYWVDNSPVVSTPQSLNTSLPAGNAIIIDVTGNNAEALSLSTTSALRHKDNWSDGNQMMGYFASAPTSLSSPFDGTHSITWRGVGSPNLFGGFNSWNTTAPLLPTGNFLVIVNPAYPNDNPDSITSNQASNGAINISCGYCLSAQIVPLSSSWSNGSIVSTSGNLRLDGEYDPSTDSWIFKNSATGELQNPVSGGLTDVDAEHITINDWLQNISHQIGSFFSGAIGAVSTLVSAGSDFIRSLSGLYAWLPAPVYTVLTSALILVITIGVIKVFI